MPAYQDLNFKVFNHAYDKGKSSVCNRLNTMYETPQKFTLFRNHHPDNAFDDLLMAFKVNEHSGLMNTSYGNITKREQCLCMCDNHELVKVYGKVAECLPAETSLPLALHLAESEEQSAATCPDEKYSLWFSV